MNEKPPDRARETAVYARKARKKLGLSQKDLGDKLGVTKQNISHVENGRQGLPHAKYVALSKLSGLPIPNSAGAPAQTRIESSILIEAFEVLPPLVREWILLKTTGLRDIYAQLPTEVKDAVSAPPKDAVSYAAWEASINELVAKVKGKKQ